MQNAKQMRGQPRKDNNTKTETRDSDRQAQTKRKRKTQQKRDKRQKARRKRHGHMSTQLNRRCVPARHRREWDHLVSRYELRFEGFDVPPSEGLHELVSYSLYSAFTQPSLAPVISVDLSSVSISASPGFPSCQPLFGFVGAGGRVMIGGKVMR